MSSKKNHRAPLKPSHEVFQRLRWDARFSSLSIFVGFDHHTGVLKEIPLHQFVPDGEIPWHRVWHFRTEGVMLWDRKTRVDRVLGSGEPADDSAIEIVAPARSVTLRRREGEALRFVRGHGWMAGDSGDIEPNRPLSILYLNVLADTYDSEKLRSNERFDHLLTKLADEDADLIALVEVTSTLADRLMNEPWVRERYAVSSRATALQLQPFGALLLSRVALLGVEWMGIADVRPALVVDLGLGDAGLRVAVIHLPSDRRESRSTLRAAQLDALCHALCDGQSAPRSPTLIVGDFNAREAETLPPRTKVFSDVWKDHHPGDSGFTFDPSCNAIAALNSAHGLAGRLDRVLFHDPSSALQANSCELWGHLAIEGSKDLFLSDHAGLRIEMGAAADSHWAPASTPLASATPTYRTALTVVIPDEIAGPIQTIRRHFDRTFDEWMPHLNLLYGFVPEEHFDEAVALLEEALVGVEPFELELSRFGWFEHRASATVHLEPIDTPASALCRLQSLLQRRFPQCDELSRRSVLGYQPHVTLGQFDDADEAIEQRNLWASTWRSCRFEVTEISLIARSEGKPFRVVRRARLNHPCGPDGDTETTSGPLNELLHRHGLIPDATEVANVRYAIERIGSLAAKILYGEAPPRVHALFGSQAIGARARGGDVDVLVRGPRGVDAALFFDSLKLEIEGSPDLSSKFLSRVDAAQVPVLGVEILGVPFDIAYVSESDDTTRAESGVNDARALATLLDLGSLGARRTALRLLRAWARARKVSGTQLGFPGGLAWTVMFLWAIQDAAHGGADELLTHAFSRLSSWDSSCPISLSNEFTEVSKRAAPRDRADRVMVMTPSTPSFNSTRTFTASTQAILHDELVRAATLCLRANETKDWRAILEPIDDDAHFDETLEISLDDARQERLDEAWGWLVSSCPRWVVLLEGRGFRRVWPRPSQTQHRGSRVAIDNDNGTQRSLRFGLRAQRPTTEADLAALGAAVRAHLDSHGAAVAVKVFSSRLP